MTWNREEALRLAGALRYAIGCATDSQAMWDAASHLESAVAEIDRRGRIEAGRERLTDTIDKLTAERDKLIVDIEASCLGYRSLVSDRNQWRSDYETLAAHRDREISTLTAELDQLRSEGAARMDATEELLRARIAELTAARDKLRSDYTGWSEYSTELADERDHWRRARDTAMEAGEVMRQQRDAVRTDFDNALEAWGKEVDAVTKERDAALARVKELEAERSQQAEAYRARGQRVSELESLAQHLEAEREAAAGEVLVSFDDMPPGSTLGKVVIANRLLKHENQNLRERIAELVDSDLALRGRLVGLEADAAAKQLEFDDWELLTKERDAAQARVKELEQAHVKAKDVKTVRYRYVVDHGDLFRMTETRYRRYLLAGTKEFPDASKYGVKVGDALTVNNLTLDDFGDLYNNEHHVHEAERQAPGSGDIWTKVDGLLQRIAELEAADESSKFAIRSIAETHNRQTDEVYALQAIIRAIYPVYRATGVLASLPMIALVSAVDSARDALTPDLIAALKAAGVE